ncbi:MAG: AraC family transcriptional regulator, partial [Actinophytocola sp.]|nr:AraC family transcriptional regulator [Actinophytocola sp.]
MLTSVGLAARPGLSVWGVRCADDHTGWSAPEVREDYRLVLVRRGRFRRHTGVAVDLEPAVGYLGAPGEEERFAHPAGGDECTSVTLSPALGARLAGGSRPAVYVDARVELAHRRVLAAGADIDYALVEAMLGLLALATAGAPAPGRTPARP